MENNLLPNGQGEWIKTGPILAGYTSVEDGVDQAGFYEVAIYVHQLNFQSSFMVRLMFDTVPKVLHINLIFVGLLSFSKTAALKFIFVSFKRSSNMAWISNHIF